MTDVPKLTDGSCWTALFVAVKAVTRQRVRSVIVALIALVSVGLLYVALFALNAINPTVAQWLAGSGDIVLGTSVTEEDATVLAGVEGVLQSRYGAETEVSWAVLANDATVTGADGVVSTNYREHDFSQVSLTDQVRLTEGRQPGKAGEVVLTGEMAEQLGVSVGDTVELALTGKTVTVVGLGIVRLSHSTSTVFGYPGTWASLGVSDAGLSGGFVIYEIQANVPDSAGAALTADTQSDESSDSTLGDLLSPYDAYVVGVQATASETRSFWVKNAVVFTWPMLALLVLLSAVQLFVRMRRDNAVLGALSVQGLSKSGVVLALSTMNLLPAVCGVVAGVLSGAVLGTVLAPVIANIADMDPSGRPIPWNMVILLPVLYLAAYAGFACLIAVREANRGRVANVSVNFGEPGSRPKPVFGFATVGAVLILVGIGLAGFLSGEQDSSLIVMAVVCAGLVLFTPLGIAALARMIRPSRTGLWLALRIERADVWRFLGMVAVVGYGLAAPLGMVISDYSMAQAKVAAYIPSVPAGQVEVDLSTSLSAEQQETLDAAAGVDAVEVDTAEDTDGNEFSAVPAGTDLDALDYDYDTVLTIVIVQDRAAADTVLGWQMSDADWTMLSSGEGLYLGTTIPEGSQTVDLTNNAYGDDSVDEITASTSVALSPTAETPTNTALGQGSVVFTAQEAEDLGMSTVVTSLRYPDAAGAIDRIQDAAASIGIPAVEVTSDAGAAYETPTTYWTALWASLGMILVTLSVLVVLSTRENRGITQRLTFLGVPSRILTRISLYVATLPVIIGSLIGILTSLGTSTALLSSYATSLVLPWAQIALIAALVISISIASSWISSTAVTRHSQRTKTETTKITPDQIHR